MVGLWWIGLKWVAGGQCKLFIVLCAGFIQVMENLESHGIYDIISISRAGKSWNSSEGHGKAICFPKIKMQ